MKKVSKLLLMFQVRLFLSLLLLGLFAGCNFNPTPPTETPVAVAPSPATTTPTSAPPSPTATLPPTRTPAPSTMPSLTPIPSPVNVRQGDELSLPSPTPTPQEGVACVVRGAVLDLREGPAPHYPVTEVLSSGSSILALKSVSEGSWLLVEGPRREVGWAEGELLSCQGDLASLPLALGLPTPPVQVAAQLPAPVPSPSPTPPPATDTPAPPAPVAPPLGRWRGEYYDNASLLGDPVLVREDEDIDFNWILDSPGAGIPADDFSVRWTGIFEFTEAGDYRFFASVDDGVRLYLDGWLVIDAWQTALPVDYSGTFADVQPGLHTIVVEYFESGGHARAKVWSEHGKFASGDWAGDYYNNNFEDPLAFTRHSREIDFDWGEGSPDERLSRHHFSVRWRRTLYFEHGDYRFFAEVEEEDRVRVKVDGWVVIDEEQEDSGTAQGRFERMGGGNHTIEVEYEEYGGDAGIKFWWERD